MRQALHIFLKDTRQFRYPIAVMLVWTAIFALAGAAPWFAFREGPTWGTTLTYQLLSVSPYVFPFGWLYLIAQVFHAEALPGNQQFWLTRPYGRAALFAAKALFVLAYITLPLTVAQATIVMRSGLPLTTFLSGLLWEQVLITALVVLPGAALASMTSTLPQFVLGALTAAGVFLSEGLLPGWYGFGWIRSSIAITAIVAIASIVLVVQFARRRTLGSRAVALVGTFVVIVTVQLFPWTTAFAFQGRFVPPWEGNLSAELVRPVPQSAPRLESDPGIELKYRVAGPRGVPIACEAREVTIASADGSVWSTGAVLWGGFDTVLQGWSNASLDALSNNPIECRLSVRIPLTVLDAVADRPVTINTSLYVTVFGPEQSTRVVVDQPPTAIPNAGLCGGTRHENRTLVECRTAFRQPRPWVSSMNGGTVWGAARFYSPFPAEFRIAPVDYAYQGFSDLRDQVSITTREPVAHIRTAIATPDVYLRDFEFRRAPGTEGR